MLTENEIDFSSHFLIYQKLKEVFAAFSKVSIDVEFQSNADKQSTVAISLKELKIIEKFEGNDELYLIEAARFKQKMPVPLKVTIPDWVTDAVHNICYTKSLDNCPNLPIFFVNLNHEQVQVA